MCGGGGFLFDDLDCCLTTLTWHASEVLRKCNLHLGNEENTKQSLALEPGVLISASDPYFQ